MGDEYCLNLVISVPGELERVRSKPWKLVMLLLVLSYEIQILCIGSTSAGTEAREVMTDSEISGGES